MMMVERQIYSLLSEGITDFVANPTKIVDFFEEQGGLDSVEAGKIADLIMALPPTVTHGYAREDAKFPLYTVVLQNEGTQANYLGDDGDNQFLGSGAFAGRGYAKNMNAAVTVLIYAQDPDSVLYLYHLARYSLMARQQRLSNMGLMNIQFQGNDVSPDAGYVPNGLFMRRLTFSASYVYTQPSIDTTQRAFLVDGVFGQPDGNNRDQVGDVQTNVTVYDATTGESLD